MWRNLGGKILLFTLFVLPTIGLATGSGVFEKDPIRQTLGNACNEPCIIDINRGGFLPRFMYVAYLISHGARKQVVINGHCISSCTIFADMVRPKVCITPDAVFGFHKGWPNLYEMGINLEVRYEPFVSSDILDWLKEHDAFPATDDWKGMVYMTPEDAATFWPRCSRTVSPTAQGISRH